MRYPQHVVAHGVNGDAYGAQDRGGKTVFHVKQAEQQMFCPDAIFSTRVGMRSCEHDGLARLLGGSRGASQATPTCRVPTSSPIGAPNAPRAEPTVSRANG